MAKWNDKDINFLKDNYTNLTDEELAIKLNRTKNSIERKRNSLGLFKKVQYSKIYITEEMKKEILDLKVSVNQAYKIFAPKYHITRSQIEHLYKENKVKRYISKKWTSDDIEFLKNNYDKLSTQEIADALNRTPTAVSKKRIMLGLEASNIIYNKPDRNWTKKEIEFLRKNIENVSYKDIALRLNRTEKAVMVKATKLNLINRGSNWTKGEEKLLIDNIDLTIYELIFILERSEKSIRHKANELGLKIVNRKKETKIEKVINEVLQDLNVDYERYAKPVKEYKYEADFLIGNIILEINGDYYHGNPKFFNTLDTIQTINVKKDAIKKEIFESHGYKVYYLWEYDICNNIDDIKNKIACIIRNNNV